MSVIKCIVSLLFSQNTFLLFGCHSCKKKILICLNERTNNTVVKLLYIYYYRRKIDEREKKEEEEKIEERINKIMSPTTEYDFEEGY